LLFSFFSSDSKFLSLQRQLNNYGFQNQSGCSTAAAGGGGKDNDSEHGRIVYAHPDFHQQSDPTLIETLLRVKNTKNAGSSSSVTLRSTRTPTSSSSRTRKSTPVAVASMEVVRSDHIASTIVVTKTETKSATPPPPFPEPTLPMSSSAASMKTSPTTSKEKGPAKLSLKNKRPPSFLVSKNNVEQKENLVAAKGNYKRLKVTFVEANTDDDQLRDKMSTPEHSSMISTFLSTPVFQRSNTYGYEPWAPNKMHHTASSSSSSSSPPPSVCMAGLRVLFHCSPRAVKYSPLVPVQCPPSSPSSPMMSMVDMDLDCFEKAMDALSPPHHRHH
jgi:hypothetical protein